MRKFKLTASDGEVLTGHLPENWAEVPLSLYAALAATAQPVPDVLQSGAHVLASEASCEALAALLGLPTAEPFHTDFSLLLDLYEAAPWLFVGPLPEAEITERFDHQGTTYEYAGGLSQALGGQMEALLNFLRDYDGQPLGVGHKLLAVLYKPAGQKQTTAAVTAAAAAFQSLPMSIAYPALQGFFLRSSHSATPILKFLAVRPEVEKALNALETATASPSSASPGRFWNMRRWLITTWLRRVRRKLGISSPHSAFTVAATS